MVQVEATIARNSVQLGATEFRLETLTACYRYLDYFIFFLLLL